MNKKVQNLFKQYFTNFRLGYKFEDKDFQYVSDDVHGIVVRSIKGKLYVINDLYYDKAAQCIRTHSQYIYNYTVFRPTDYTGIENYIRNLLIQIKSFKMQHKLSKIQEDFQ